MSLSVKLSLPFNRLLILIFVAFAIMPFITGCEKGGTVTGSARLVDDGFGSLAGALVIDPGTVASDGTVSYLGGTLKPATGAEVMVRGTEIKTVADGLGRFLLERVPIGSITLVVRSGEYLAALESIEVVTGKVSEVGHMVLARPGTLHGIVRLPDAINHEGIEIFVPSLGSTIITGPAGTFEFSGLPVGRASFSISKFGYRTIAAGVTIEPGSSVDAGVFPMIPSSAVVLSRDFSGPVPVSGIMALQNSPYRPGGDIVVPHGSVLVIEPGVEILFSPAADATAGGLYSGIPGGPIPSTVAKLSEMIVHGAIHASGTLAEPIVFSSSAASPAAGDWGGIHFAPDSSDELCRIESCEIRWAATAISAEDSGPFLDRVSVFSPSESGMTLYGATGIKVSRSSFSGGRNCLRTIKKVAPTALGDFFMPGGSITGSFFFGAVDTALALEGAGGLKFTNSIVTANPSGAVKTSGCRTTSFKGCVLANSMYGIWDESSTSISVTDCVIVSNRNFGFRIGPGTTAGNNCVYGNARPDNDSRAQDGGNYMGGPAAPRDLQLNPGFVSPDYAAPDKGDWTISPSSPLRGAGAGGGDIGPIDPAAMGPKASR